MAKPVSGYLGYDTDADRPTVLLGVGRKLLLTEDDTAPHHTTHENGGTDEISVAGLSGVLADNQVAGSLDTSGSAVNVDAAAPPSTGQVLMATDATHATWQTPTTGSVVSEFWAPPASAHANDQEFTSSTLPASWSLWETSTNPATAGTIVSGIDYLTQPAAGTVRIEAHKSGRRSWLLMQPRGSAESWFYGFSVTLGNNGHVFRARLGTHIKVDGNALLTGTCTLLICRNDAGKPNTSAGFPGYFMFGGWVNRLNTAAWEFAKFTNTAGSVTVKTGADLDQLYTQDAEVVFVLRAGTTTWDFWLCSASLTTWLGAHDFVSSSMANGNTVWVGFSFTGVSSNQPSSPIVRADYLREEDVSTNFIP